MQGILFIITVALIIFFGFVVGVHLTAEFERDFEKEERILEIAKDMCEKGDSYPVTVKFLEVRCADGLVFSRKYLEKKLEEEDATK